MATIIKIVLVLAVLTASAQGGMAALTNFQFEDDVHEALVFSPNVPEDEIRKTVLSLARKHGLEVLAENITIRETGPELKVDITYDAEVNLLPGIYARVFTFKPATSVRLLSGSLR